MSQSNPAQQSAPIMRKRDSEYYALDDGVVFLIEDTLYRISRSLLVQSDFFREMFASPFTGDGSNAEGRSDEHPICPEGITTLEIKNLLRLLNARALEGIPDFTLEQLGAILTISTKWGFESARAYAINQIDQLDAPTLDRIEMAFKGMVPKWLFPAYEELCTRHEQLTIEEATRLGIPRYFIVSKIREVLQPAKVKFPPEDGCNGTVTLNNSYGTKQVACRCKSCGWQFGDKTPVLNLKDELNKYKGELGLPEI